ncbi:MAG: cupin domain-containing protein [Bacteroidales bacterium]|nr:cupin domain-containing protein [Bacteroidales bacterium]
MIIDFEKIQQDVIPHFKGGEGETKNRMFFDGTNKIMHGTLEPGCTIGYHNHETSSEIIYILSGDARVLYDDGEEHLVPGQCHYCPKGHSHSLINASPNTSLTYIAVVPEQ